MILETTLYDGITSETVSKYFGNLINKIFKLLPMVEEGDNSIETYIDGLQVELDGCHDLIVIIREDPIFISLLSTLAWLRQNALKQDCSFKRIRREIFQAISICKKMEESMLKLSDGGE